ncbi:hypothetical protein AYO47_00335 [Planctomyces sp. SCGC AG-212-M04]|nr:hypothetical protein AYO47_00335 [Planctomyces sp. SCGC AG-212-M04]
MNEQQSMFRGNPLEGLRQDSRKLVDLLGKLQSSDRSILAECRETAQRLNTELARQNWESLYPGYPFAK